MELKNLFKSMIAVMLFGAVQVYGSEFEDEPAAITIVGGQRTDNPNVPMEYRKPWYKRVSDKAGKAWNATGGKAYKWTSDKAKAAWGATGGKAYEWLKKKEAKAFALLSTKGDKETETEFADRMAQYARRFNYAAGGAAIVGTGAYYRKGIERGGRDLIGRGRNYFNR